MALLANGTLKAWGLNHSGSTPVGDGSDFTVNRLVPVTVVDINDNPVTDVKDLFAGHSTNFAILGNGTVMGWGSNSGGMLGIGNNGTHKPYAVEVTEIYNATTIYPGGSSSIAKRYNGTVVAFGVNNNGEICNSTYTVYYTPEIIDISNADNIFIGAFQTFVEKVDGSFWGCGYNAYGELGIGNTTTKISTPTEIGFHRLIE